MSYLTPAQLILAPGMLGEVAEPFGIDPDLMAATIKGGDRSAWSASEIAEADAALQAVLHTIVTSEGELNGYLVRRGYNVATLSGSAHPVLQTWTRSVFRYHWQPQRDRNNEETGRIERDYRQTLRTVDQLGKGSVTLGENDPLSSGGVGMPAFEGPARQLTDDFLAGY